MRECLTIIFQCYDGNTWVNFSVGGQPRTGLLALCSLVVDGGDYPWLTDTRGANSLLGCGRCHIPRSRIGSNVTSNTEWLGMRRKYTGELADLLKARLMGKTDCAHFMQLCGKNPEAADNPLYGVFGVLKDNDWVIARTLAVEPLHTMEAGVFMQIQLLMVQLPQRLHELAGVPVSAESQAALFADRVIAGSAMSSHTLIAAVPTKLRHSTWVASTVKRHISRAKGLRKPPAVRLEFRYMNAWHYRDLGRSLAVWVLQPDFLGLLLKGPVVRPLWNVRDFFGEWLPFNPPPERAPFGYFVQQTIQVNVSELQLLLAEVWCLLARWNEHFQIDEISTRQLSELRLLDNEFHEAAKAVLAFKATWKKHQMEEAPESRMDLGNQVTANLSESAHKLSKLLWLGTGQRWALHSSWRALAIMLLQPKSTVGSMNCRCNRAIPQQMCSPTSPPRYLISECRQAHSSY